MRFSVESRGLAAGLKVVSAAVSRTLHRPILGGVQITASAKSIRIECTDLELTIQHSIDAAVDKTGVAVVPVGPLRQVIKAVGAGKVTFELDGKDTLGVQSADASAALHLLPSAEWPASEPMADDGSQRTVILDAEGVDILRRVAYAASTDLDRPALCGVAVDGDQMFATDSYRLAITTFDDVAFPAATLPTRAVRAALASNPDSLTIEVGERRAILAVNGTTWRTALVGESPPDPASLIRTNHDREVTVARVELEDALVGIGSFGTGETPTKLTARDGTLTLTRTQQSDKLAVTIGAVGDGEVAVNHRFLLELVKVLTGDTVTFGLLDEKPVIVRDDGLTHLLMPVRMS